MQIVLQVFYRIIIVVVFDICMVISLETQSFSQSEGKIDVTHYVVGVVGVAPVASYHSEVALDDQPVVEKLR